MHQITVRGYPVREVSRRLGVSAYSLYNWMKLFGDPSPKKPGIDHEAENRRLKRELARVTQERDILKTVPGRSPPVRGSNSLCWAIREGQSPIAYWWAGPR